MHQIDMTFSLPLSCGL